MTIPTPPRNNEACQNTDRELFRESVDAFSPSLHDTLGGGLGISVDGSVHVKPLRSWHALAEKEAKEPQAKSSSEPRSNKAIAEWFSSCFNPKIVPVETSYDMFLAALTEATAAREAQMAAVFKVLPPDRDVNPVDEALVGIPQNLHPDTTDLVLRFASALATKLRKAEQKYGYDNGWKSPDWMDECRKRLREHLEKGDPRDVAAYCAFLWHHGESTASKPAGGGI